jgi:hypothetical protein
MLKMNPVISFKLIKKESAPLSSAPSILKSVFQDKDDADKKSEAEILTSQTGSRGHWIETKKRQRKAEGIDYPDVRNFYELHFDFSRKQKLRQDFDSLREESFRQQDNYLKVVLWSAYEKNVLPSIKEDRSKAINVILFLAKINIKDKVSIDDIEKEVIKNIQSSYYILAHEDEERKRFARRYLLETLFNPGALLKDDYSLDENKLAIVNKGSNFADFLLNSHDMGFSLFQKFLSEKTFSLDPDSDEKIKQKLLESMIFSTPLTIEIYKPVSAIINSFHAFENFNNSLNLIPDANIESFCINVLGNFALRSAEIKISSFYVDSVILSIKQYNSKDNWAEAINEIFSHPNKEENPIKSAFGCDNDTYLLKVKEFIDEACEEKTQEKQNFIKKLAKNCGFDESVLEKKFESLGDKRASSFPTKSKISQPGRPFLFRQQSF